MVRFLGASASTVLVFDLDDTLYPEISFVHSGFQCVAHYIQSRWKIPATELFDFMIAELQENGRGAVFDALREVFEIPDLSVREAVSIYRYHEAKLELFPGAWSLLERLSQEGKYPMYLLTDGNARVQRSKIKALGVSRFFNKTYCSRDFGLSSEKPSVHVLRHIAKAERVPLSSLIYIGDDPNKDFHGIIEAGGNAVRVRTGRFKDVDFSESEKLLGDLGELGALEETLGAFDE